MSLAVKFSRNAECGSKARYISKHEAKLSARRSETYQACGHLEVYRCSWCKQFHIGHPPHPNAIALAAQRRKTFDATDYQPQGATP